MNNERIQLPDFLIADLYKRTLVEIETYPAETLPLHKDSTVKTEKEIFSQGKIEYLGKNEKKIIIIVNQADVKYLHEDDLTFLTSILKACQLNLADIAIINIAAEKVNYQDIKDQLHAQDIILFDVEPSAIKLPFMIPTFQIQKHADCTLMIAPALSHINKPTQEGKLLKTKLWVSLKQVFGIS